MVVVTNVFWQGPAQKLAYLFQIILKHMLASYTVQEDCNLFVILVVWRSTKEVTSRCV